MKGLVCTQEKAWLVVEQRLDLFIALASEGDLEEDMAYGVPGLGLGPSVT